MTNQVRSASGGRLAGRVTAPGQAGGRRLAWGTGIMLLGGGISMLANFAALVLVGRAVGATAAGRLFEVVAVFSILLVVVQIGTGTGLVRTVAGYATTGNRDAIRKLLRRVVVPVSLLAIVVGYLLVDNRSELSGVISGPADRRDVSQYLFVAGLFLPLAVLSAALLAIGRGMGSLLIYPLAENVVKPILRLFFLAGVVAAHLGTLWLGLAWFGPPIIASLSIAVFGVAKMLVASDQVGGRSVPVPGREFWPFCVRQLFADIALVGVGWLDLVLVASIVSSAAAGVYAAVGKYMFAGEAALVAISIVLAPEIGALFATGDFPRIRTVYRTATLWLGATVVPLLVVMAWFPILLLSVVGGSFADGGPALTILSTVTILSMAMGPIVMILSMGGRSGSVLIASAASLIVNVVLNVVLIPPYGLEGAAVAWGASLVTINAMSLFRCWRLWNIHPASVSMLRIVLGAGLCFSVACAGTQAWLGQTWAALFVSIALATVLYAPVLRSVRHDLHLVTLGVQARAWLRLTDSGS